MSLTKRSKRSGDSPDPELSNHLYNERRRAVAARITPVNPATAAIRIRDVSASSRIATPASVARTGESNCTIAALVAVKYFSAAYQRM